MACHDIAALESEILNRLDELTDKIKERLAARIEEVSRKMAEDILSNQKLSNITESIRKHVLSLGADIASCALNDIAENESTKHKIGRLKGKRKRTLATLLGPVSYERTAFYNAIDAALTFPADTVLEINNGQMQGDVLSRLVKLGIEMPFSQVASLCESVMGVRISEGTVYNAVVTAGQHASYESVMPSVSEINETLDKLKTQKPNQKVHIVVGVDGAMEPLRPQESKRKGERGEYFWKECKGFRAYAVCEDESLEQLASWHQIGSDEDLGAHLVDLSKRLSHRPEPIVVVADGAKWIWNQVSKSFSNCREVLDWYHVVQHLASFAEVQYGKDKSAKQKWLEQAKDRLMTDKVETVINGLSKMKYASLEAQRAAETLSGYLIRNKGRMTYGTFKEDGLTIGSGGMESANKSVSHLRLKRTGCWWKMSHANEILRLRCAKANGTLEKILNSCWTSKA